MPEQLVLVVGEDALCERVVADLTAGGANEVRVVWPLEASREADFRKAGATVLSRSLESDEALLEAGVAEAVTLLALSADDGMNLSVALRARCLNPALRIVLRQFVVSLGRKIEQNLPDCAVLSPAAHSAATFAAAALEPDCFFGLTFPESGGPIVGFSRKAARGLGVAGMTVGQAEERLGIRIAAIDSRRDPPAGAIVARSDTLTIFGQIGRGAATGRARVVPRVREARPSTPPMRRLVNAYQHANPILRGLTIAAVVFFSLSYCYFHLVLGKTLTASAFYVVATMTNVGFGEVSVAKRGPLITSGAIAAMLGGIVFTSIFIGSVASALTRAQWTAHQGLRRIRARRHIVVCGCGKVGTAVLDLLTAAGKRVVVIDPEPHANLVRRARDRDVDLLTGDASRGVALDLCDLPNADALLALTDRDAVNLEIALGARVYAPDIPLVVRMEDASFAQATTKLFDMATFSPAKLTAPAFAGLSRVLGTRGRVRLGNDERTITERAAAAEDHFGADAVPLCVWREGRVVMLREFDQRFDGEPVLYTNA